MIAARRVVALLALLGLAAGCAGGVPPRVLQSWVGRPAGALQKDWGPPTREVQDGDLRILVYEEVERQSRQSQFDDQDPRRTRGTYGYAHDAAVAAFRAPTVYARSYLFWVNREGTIVHSTVRNP
jgi:hypothetical protein